MTTTNRVAIRMARAADADAVLRLTRAAFDEYRNDPPLHGALRETEPDVLQWFEGGFILLAEVEAKIAGAVRFKPVEDREWYLGRLAVDPKVRQHGVGSLLLAGGETEVGRRGGRSIQLSVRRTHVHLPPWYEGRGYYCYGRSEPEVSGYPGSLYYRKELVDAS